jgi:hypothetical protein
MNLPQIIRLVFCLAFLGFSQNCFAIYHPELGRWISRDPIGESGGNNLYGMVANDPVSSWDYLGLAIAQEVMSVVHFPPKPLHHNVVRLGPPL